MNIAKPFILRPVATLLLTLALLVLGLWSYSKLPMAALPQVDYPIIQVRTPYPGASAEVVQLSVTAPLQQQLGRIAGLQVLSSSSAAGQSLITLQFSLDMPLHTAEQQVQAALSLARLPFDLPSSPQYAKVNPGDAPVISVAVYSDRLPLHEVRDIVEKRIVQKVAQLPGVGLLNVVGGNKPAIRIQVDPQRLASAGLTLQDVRQLITRQHVYGGTGSIDGDRRSTTLSLDGQLRDVAAYQALILQHRPEGALRLGDVAHIIYDAEDPYQAAWVDGRPAIMLTIQRQPQANTIALVDALNQRLPELQAQLPSGVHLQAINDRSVSIKQSVAHVQQEMLLAMALVILVTFVFLRRPAATFIPSVVVPISIVGTFAVMHALGFSLNNLSLMALTIATGFVVDDAIVMTENITRYVEQGEPPLQAALKGAKEIGFTLISLTLSLVAVFIPLLFMADVLGRLFQEFAMTMVVAIGISLLISLTLTPMLAARLLGSATASAVILPAPMQLPVPVQDLPLPASTDRWRYHYARLLKTVLHHQGLTLGVAVATLLLTLGLYVAVPKGFFPAQDTGMVQAISLFSPKASFERIATEQQALAQRLAQDPAVASVSAVLGVDAQSPTLNQGRLQLTLREEREAMPEVLARLHQAVADLPDVQLFLQPVQALTVDTQLHKGAYQLRLRSVDPDVLATWVPELARRLQALPQLQSVHHSYQDGGLRLHVQVDRDRATALGISVDTVHQALQNAFGQRFVSTIFTQAAQYRVVLTQAPDFAKSPQDVQALLLRGQQGLVRLDEVATLQWLPEVLEYQGLNQFHAALISFDVPGALSQAVLAIEQVLQQASLPAELLWEWQGATQAFEASLRHTLWLLLAALFTMYVVLGVLYESYIHPITILSTLPSATIGALLALWWAGKPLDMVGVIGLLLLIGIVKKNAIMMIDFALHAQRQGVPALQAIYHAALLRFRPILMTTLAALFGAVPLLLSTGVGAEMRVPLGLVLVGGLLCSQVLTIFTTPVIYLFFDRWQRVGR